MSEVSSIKDKKSFFEDCEEAPTLVRVSYAEVDRMGYAYYGHYLRWFEIGRCEFLRQRGKTYKELETEGLLLPVIEAHVHYHKPATYDDLLEIRTCLRDISGVRLTFGYRVFQKDEKRFLAEGYTEHVCAGVGGRPRRIPENLKSLIRIRPA